MRGSISPRGKGVWRLRYDVGVRTDGRRKQDGCTVHGTKRQAEAELARILHEIATGTYLDPHKVTVGQFLEDWLQRFARPKVAPKTLETYEDFARKHIIPTLGHLRLSQLRAAHLQDYYNGKLKSGRLDGMGGLSPRSVLHQHRFLRTALQRAVKLRLIPQNPADGTDPPQPGEEVEHEVLTEAQTVRLLLEARGTLLYIPIVLAAATGLRRGEILGLRWQDLDLDRLMLTVRQSVSQARGEVFFKSPKTKKRRVETLPECIIPALVHHRGAQAQARLLAGPLWRDYDLVNPRSDGRPQTPNTFTRAFAGLIRKLDLPAVTFHELRHTHVTALLDRGVELKAVSDRVGHSSIQITADIYGHRLLGKQRQVAGVVNEMLGPAFEPAQQGSKHASGSHP